MLCCLLAGLLALAGIKGRQPRAAPPNPSRPLGTRQGVGSHAAVVGFGACCGVLAFEAAAAVAAWVGGLDTRRPQVVLVAASAVTVLGALLGLRGGAPSSRRAWAVFALSASGGSALTELADLHLLGLHSGPTVVASVVVHGLAVLSGIVAGQLLLRLGHEGGPASLPPRSARQRSACPARVQPAQTARQARPAHAARPAQAAGPARSSPAA